MPTKNASPSVKLAVLRREVGIGVSQAKDGRLSKRSISDIAEALRNGHSYKTKSDLPCPVHRTASDEGLLNIKPDSVPGDIRRPAGVLGVTYIAPDFDEPSTSITDLFEGRD